MRDDTIGAVNASGSVDRLVYDVSEVGKMLGLSRNSTYEAIAKGDIPCIRVGKLIKVPKAAFDRLLNPQR